MPLKKLVPGWKKREEKREEEREKKRAFLKNGGLVLEKLVASCNGRPIPIRTFSYQQLILVTNSFDPRLILHEDWQYKIYKGSFEGRILSINMNVANKYTTASEVLTNMGISAKMSAHKNVLKLVGCCLETSFPTLVFEYAQNGVLSDRIYTSRRPGTPMVWQSRLKISRQIAHTIAYIHTAFSRPIIHRDIKPVNIFLDQHDVPKLTNFSLSVTIPEGETQVEESVCGTFGYLCPSYARTGTVIEKTDVYSFGIVLLELLTGRRLSDFAEDYNSEDFNAEDFSAEDVSTKDIDLPSFAKNHAINEIVDSAILAEEGGAGVEQQLEAVRQLGLTCVEFNPEIRPTMVDVTKELRRIERMFIDSCKRLKIMKGSDAIGLAPRAMEKSRNRN